jgi:hypothetical protein
MVKRIKCERLKRQRLSQLVLAARDRGGKASPRDVDFQHVLEISSCRGTADLETLGQSDKLDALRRVSKLGRKRQDNTEAGNRSNDECVNAPIQYYLASRDVGLKQKWTPNHRIAKCTGLRRQAHYRVAVSTTAATQKLIDSMRAEITLARLLGVC